MPTLLAAPDKFRSTASAAVVAAAIGRGARRQGWDATEVPMSDGGEGFLEIYGAAEGARPRTTRVTGPLGRPVESEWGLAGTVAVIEMARASGLVLAGGPDLNDPLAATTRGTGELIAAAVSAGAKRIVIGCGGSATTDGGEGAIDALRPHSRLLGVEVVVACDVRTCFLEAAERFSAQKGASPRQVELLTRRLHALAERYRQELGVDVTHLPGGGAAGGLAGGLAALGARLVSGVDEVAAAVGLEDRVSGADLVVTGEGFLDSESLHGKVVGSVAQLACDRSVPVVAVVGDVEDPLGGEGLPFPVISLVERFGSDRALSDVESCVEEAVASYLSAFTS